MQLPCDAASTLPETYQRELKFTQKICNLKFTVTLFIIAKNWEENKHVK